MTRILLLGGTTEASRLARALADAGMDAVFSYAGRTDAPVAQPLPMRVGGFGGVSGLADYLRREGITHVVDATHPFAARMSGNAIAACAETGTPLIALERAPWQAQAGDDWRHVADIDAAVAALPDDPARVFLAIGKQTLAPFAAKPQHHYLLRLVDPLSDGRHHAVLIADATGRLVGLVTQTDMIVALARLAVTGAARTLPPT